MNCPECDKAVEEHDAGHCMDTWVAEAVMGWRRMTYAEAFPGWESHVNDNRLTMHWHDPNGQFEGTSGIGEMVLAEDDEDYECPQQAWSPSTQIADAWMVFESVPASDRSISEGWNCYFLAREQVHACAATAPLAICRAALIASVAEGQCL